MQQEHAYISNYDAIFLIMEDKMNVFEVWFISSATLILYLALENLLDTQRFTPKRGMKPQNVSIFWLTVVFWVNLTIFKAIEYVFTKYLPF